MLFHPSQPRAWVLGELTGAVTTCDWDAQTGALTVIASTPVLDNGGASAAAIRMHPSTRTLWISLRASPSLLGFRLDPNGMLGMTEIISLESGEPRDFAISPDGRWLVTANQNANDIVVIELDPSTGLPTGSPHQHFPINTPVCVLFLTETS
jgi:6-phosphogluconolactonase